MYTTSANLHTSSSTQCGTFVHLFASIIQVSLFLSILDSWVNYRDRRISLSQNCMIVDPFSISCCTLNLLDILWSYLEAFSSDGENCTTENTIILLTGSFKRRSQSEFISPTCVESHLHRNRMTYYMNQKLLTPKLLTQHSQSEFISPTYFECHLQRNGVIYYINQKQLTPKLLTQIPKISCI